MNYGGSVARTVALEPQINPPITDQKQCREGPFTADEKKNNPHKWLWKYQKLFVTDAGN